MSRNVPTDMQTSLVGPDTTTCRLLKITTRNSPSTVVGMTNLDVAIPYDDGEGEVQYVATRGFDPSVLRSDLGLSVDNAEARALISDTVEGVTEEMVKAGEFDDAEWVLYLVDALNLTPGSHIVLGSGYLGDVSMLNEMVWIPELLDLGVKLRQPVGEVTSRRCRATFGLPATPENRQRGCGVDITGFWQTGTVQSVGTETDRVFEGDAIDGGVSGLAPVPGRVQFLTGDNAGREFAVESIDSLTISLVETTTYPIQAGDTYRIRPHCGLRYLEDCIGQWNNGPNFKGEPNIPDGSDVSAPK